MVVFGLVGLGHRQPFSLNGLVLGCKVLVLLWHGKCCVDRLRVCRMLTVELVDIAAARLVLLVCIDTCKVCLLFPPTHPGGGR